ncbi:MAG: metallophosphoesterase family protein [Thermoguttaceae bacterium]|nr:metallophosphoesterase family protein [Thermoguttaceae bacterium]
MTCSRRSFLTAAALALSAAAAGRPAAAEAEKPVLKFKDGKFRILQFTDLHTAYNDEEEVGKSAKTVQRVGEMLAKEKPDFAVLTGDLVTKEVDLLSGGLAAAWENITRPFDEAGVPFAIAFGNHDHERQATMPEQLAMIDRAKMNLTYSADPTHPGAGTCWLPVLGADGNEAARLWCFDSQSYPTIPDMGTYAWISYEQIEWYRAESAKAEASVGHPIPGLAFFHIPLPEIWKVHNAEAATGTIGEPPCPPDLNSGLFTAMIERGDILGVFFGHDHDDDYAALYKGIALVYGRKTGFGSYGDMGLERGGRIIELTEGKPGFDTYISVPQGEELSWSHWK